MEWTYIHLFTINGTTPNKNSVRRSEAALLMQVKDRHDPMLIVSTSLPAAKIKHGTNVRWPWGTHLVGSRLWVNQLRPARFNWAQLGSTEPSSVQLRQLSSQLNGAEPSWAQFIHPQPRTYTKCVPQGHRTNATNSTTHHLVPCTPVRFDEPEDTTGLAKINKRTSCPIAPPSDCNDWYCQTTETRQIQYKT